MVSERERESRGGGESLKVKEGKEGGLIFFCSGEPRNAAANVLRRKRPFFYSPLLLAFFLTFPFVSRSLFLSTAHLYCTSVSPSSFLSSSLLFSFFFFFFPPLYINFRVSLFLVCFVSFSLASFQFVLLRLSRPFVSVFRLARASRPRETELRSHDENFSFLRATRRPKEIERLWQQTFSSN